MVYNATLWSFDWQTHLEADACLHSGATVYRVGSLNHSATDVLLSGGGSLASRCIGRFNAPQQRATYCSNNALLCIAEVLYHNYRTMLRRLLANQPGPDLRPALHAKRMLRAVEVHAISDLLYLDSEVVTTQYGHRLSGTMTVSPDECYAPYNEFGNDARADGKRGIIYPSARHSEDACLVLFLDEKTAIARDVASVPVDLYLVPEDFDPAKHQHVDPGDMDIFLHPSGQKAHATMGYYMVPKAYEDLLASLCADGTIYPDLPPRGLVDIVRRPYGSSHSPSGVSYARCVVVDSRPPTIVAGAPTA